jgi:hypothetical protein
MSPGGYNAFAIMRALLDRAGLFDEAIYPAFCEDVEWMIRTAKLEQPFRQKTYEDVYGVHGSEQQNGYVSGIEANAKWGNISFVMKRWPLNCNYVRRKWGCPSEKAKTEDWAGECKFGTPFNRDDVPVWRWSHSQEQRHRDHHLAWKAEHGVVDQRDGRVLFELPESYGSWDGFVYTDTPGCPLTGVLGRKNTSKCM